MMIQIIPWIWLCIDSWKEGKSVGVLALTHGNEIAGLQAQEMFVNQYSDKIIAGKLYLIQVSPESYRQAKRFIDINMNRIGTYAVQDSYEHTRLTQLLPYLQKMDIVLDIHSVPPNNGASRMGICHTKDIEIAKRVCESDIVLADADFDKKGSVISYVTLNGGVWIGIECGSHGDDGASKNALEVMCHLVYEAGLVKERLMPKHKRAITIYEFDEEIFPQTKDFHYTKPYQNFDPIVPSEIYAEDGNIIYTNETNETKYLWIIMDRVIIGDGMWFLFKSME